MPWESVIATVFQAGNRVVINSSGLFIYNGAPVHGNLLASITNADGTDKFGNQYFSVFTLYSGSEAINLHLSATDDPEISFVTGVASENEPAAVFAAGMDIGSPTGEFVTAFILGPSSSSDDIRAAIEINSNLADGTFEAFGIFTVFQGNTQIAQIASWDQNTWHFFAGFDGFGSPINVGDFMVRDSWHQASLINGWSGSGGVGGVFYRLTIDGHVEVIGDVINTTATGNSTCAQLTGVYVPGSGSINFPAAWNNLAGSNSASVPWVNYGAAGDVQITGIETANKEIFFHFFYPLDL